MIAVGIALVLIGFALVVPRGGVSGSTAARNVRLGSQRIFQTRGYQGDPSRRGRLVQTAMGLAFLAGGFVLLAASG